MTGTVAKKRKINPVPLVVHKPQDAKSTVIHINMHPKKDNAASDNGINYNFENLLTEQGNLVLDYNELFTVEHQKEQMMLEIEQRRLKEADKDNNEAEIKIANTKNKDVDLADEDDDDDDEEEDEEEDEDDDEDDEDVDLDDDEKLPKEKSKDSEVVPKKRVSALKGKALVGKYDLEDPFIDDSEEVIVETSRKAKNQGVDFFVFFGEFQSKDLQR